MAVSSSTDPPTPFASASRLECPSFRDPPPPEAPLFEPLPFWQRRVEGRPALGVPPWEVVEHRSAEQATWYRFDEPPWIDDGARLDPLSMVMLADTMPGATQVSFFTFLG